MIKPSTLSSLLKFSSKKIYTKQQCQKIISKTASTVQKIAQITLGPYGRNVMIQNQIQSPRITKDGITVIKNIQFQNRLQDSISTLIKNSVNNTNKYAGDGTTTSTILIGQIIKKSYKKLQTGTTSQQIRKGLQISRKICLQFLQTSSRKISNKNQLMNVAMISTNSKQNISQLVVQALINSQCVRIEKSQKLYNSIQYYTGLSIPQGLSTKQFINTHTHINTQGNTQGNTQRNTNTQRNKSNNKNIDKIIYNYPLIVTSLNAINNVKQIIKCLQLAKKSRKQIIIFATDFSQAVRSTLIYNNTRNIVECIYVIIPKYGQKSEIYMKNISKFTQSYLYDQYSDEKIEDIDWKHFGKARKVDISLYQTKIQVIDKQNQNKKQKQKNKNKNVQTIILVGGPNQTSMLQNYDHIIDALNSTKSAMKDGIVAGGGVTFWRLADLLDGYSGQGQAGVKVMAEALRQPRKKLMQYVKSQVNVLGGKEWEGYDLSTGKIVDMFQAGIVDSVNVVKSTIIDSISLCTVLVEVQIALAREDKNLSSVSLKDLSAKFKL